MFPSLQAVAVVGEMSQGSTIVGTYGYMAPEQFQGAAIPASDSYALGGTLLYLMSGTAPFS
jgi:eukaryotic-like serine/threonine-protein kinase